MYKILLFLFIILSFSSCNFDRQSSYKGYDSKDGSVYYKYADLGTKSGIISSGKIMEVFINYSRMNDSVFWDSRNLWYPFTVLLSYDFLSKNNSYGKILLKGNAGDSMNFIIKRDMLFTSSLNPHYSTADSMVKVNVRIAAILDSEQVKEKMKKYAYPGNNDEINEERKLALYLMLNNIPDSDKIGDIYLVPIVKGSGPEAGEGYRVSISYRGYFLNNKTFDSVPANDPLDFTIGDSGQVINGLETGIKKMREGEIAKIIIPSHSAFGEKGSSMGIVPPYTTLVYEVSIVEVTQTLKN